MNRIWIFLWIFLIVVQMLTVWINQRIFDGQGLPAGQVDPGLISLARQTNQLWPEQMEVDGPAILQRDLSRRDHLVKRESLFLKLEEIQTELSGKGTDLDIIKELKACLRTMDGSMEIERINQYVAGITHWMQSLAESRENCFLKRASLFPGANSGLPELSFELNGSPEALGKSLLATLWQNDHWRLNEFDMLVPAHDSTCWLRGSYVFSYQ